MVTKTAIEIVKGSGQYLYWAGHSFWKLFLKGVDLFFVLKKIGYAQLRAVTSQTNNTESIAPPRDNGEYKNNYVNNNFSIKPVLKSISVKETISVRDKLFLYSSGGGGHKQAMEAMVARALEESEQEGEALNYYRPKKIDLMLDWLGRVGKVSVNRWDDAQKLGGKKGVDRQKSLVAKQPAANFVFGPVIYYKLYHYLEKHPNIKNIVNTQAMCNKQVCQAVLDINQKYHRDITVDLVLTDLPTPRAIHFWNSLKNLTPAERNILTLQTVMPLNETNESYQSFFNVYCGPGLKVAITEPPVRKAFLKGEHRSRERINRDRFLAYNWKHQDEQDYLKSIENIKWDPIKKQVNFQIDPNEKVISLMLGSQGSAAILEYIKVLIAVFTENNISPQEKIILFVYCGSSAETSSELFKKVVQTLQKVGPLPKNLRIVPLGNQNARAIAEGLERADKVIMRTGGGASFEALVMARQNPNAEFLLHSESLDENNYALLEAIPLWERGNAEFLQYKLKAKLINPAKFKRILKHYLHLEASSAFKETFKESSDFLTQYPILKIKPEDKWYTPSKITRFVKNKVAKTCFS